MLEVNKVYQGDNLFWLGMLDNESIDLTVTSPPYDNLRTYGGFSWDFEGVAKELYRVTKQGGVVVWVVGDATVKGSETGTSFKQALYFMECGFNLHDTMMYAKNTYVPLTHNRYEQSFEYMFVFSKDRPSIFNPIKIPCESVGHKINRSKSKGTEVTYSVRGREEITTTKETKYHPNIFYYNVGHNEKTKHNAPFPSELAMDHINTWSNEGDLVLDPFGGSGTTAVAARELKRNYITFELNPEYCQIIEERLAQSIVIAND